MQSSLFEARVVSYGNSGVEDQGKNILYKIEITKDGVTWNVRKSLEEFKDFHKRIKKTQDQLPKLPKSRLLKAKNPEVLEDRRVKLDDYVIEVIKRQDLHSNTHFIKFLEVGIIF